MGGKGGGDMRLCGLCMTQRQSSGSDYVSFCVNSRGRAALLFLVR